MCVCVCLVISSLVHFYYVYLFTVYTCEGYIHATVRGQRSNQRAMCTSWFVLSTIQFPRNLSQVGRLGSKWFTPRPALSCQPLYHIPLKYFVY